MISTVTRLFPLVLRTRLISPCRSIRSSAAATVCGLRTTQRLVDLRRERKIRFEDLARMRCVLAKAKPFFITSDYHPQQADSTSVLLREQLRDRPQPQQMGLWG